MRKNVFGRKLKRDKNARKALFKGLMSSLVLEERIKTTEAKAKAIKGGIEKLVTRALAEKGGIRHSLFDKHLTPPALIKLFKDVAPRFQGRPGGYTRIIKLNRRLKDNAPMVVMEWVEEPIKKVGEVSKVLKVSKAAGKVSSKTKLSKTQKLSKVSKTKSKTARTKKAR